MYYKGVADTIGIRVNVLTPAQLKDIWPLRETDGVIGAIRHPDDGINAMTALSVDPDNARLKG
jgi:dimethylglycine dehydrogenase